MSVGGPFAVGSGTPTTSACGFTVGSVSSICLSASSSSPQPTPGVATIHANLLTGMIEMSSCPGYASSCSAPMSPGSGFNGSLAGGTVAIGATDYFGLGNTALSGTVATSIWIAPTACTMRNLYIQTTSTQPADGTLIFTVFDNGTSTPGSLGTNTGLIITVPASQTSTISQLDTPGSYWTAVAGNAYTIQAVNGSSSGISAAIGAWGLSCTTP